MSLKQRVIKSLIEEKKLKLESIFNNIGSRSTRDELDSYGHKICELHNDIKELRRLLVHEELDEAVRQETHDEKEQPK